MTHQFSFEEHGIVINNTQLVITDNGSGEVTTFDFLNNYITLGIDEDGISLEVEENGEPDLPLRMDFSLGKYQLEIERILQDSKPVIYAIGEANVECPIFVPLQTHIILAKAGEQVGIMMVAKGNLRVMQTFTSTETLSLKIVGMINT